LVQKNHRKEKNLHAVFMRRARANPSGRRPWRPRPRSALSFRRSLSPFTPRLMGDDERIPSKIHFVREKLSLYVFVFGKTQLSCSRFFVRFHAQVYLVCDSSVLKAVHSTLRHSLAQDLTPADTTVVLQSSGSSSHFLLPRFTDAESRVTVAFQPRPRVIALPPRCQGVC